MEVMWTTLVLALVSGALTLAKGRSESSCRLQGTPRPASFSQPGDFVIGGVFSIHFYVITTEHNYTSRPETPHCTGRYLLHQSGFQVAVKVAFQLANGIEPIFFPNQSCSKSATVNAVVGDMLVLLSELEGKALAPLQWIGSEAWVTDREMLRFRLFAGAIGFSISRSVIPGLRDFLLDLGPEQVSHSPILTKFWESAFGCSLGGGQTAERQKACDGKQNLRDLQNPYTDTSQLRISNMVYKAVYAIAHAMHSIICTDEPNTPPYCNTSIRVEPQQVTRDGRMEFVTVGYYDASAPDGQVFTVQKNITWAGGQPQVISP
ncbi:hypothetical protein SKAU_G00428130 [Synaphobranchus kaupii]|uniref:Receptor ligand binding region domain-containing protein n=1 Tax=Synaphobranchus kaupii TaxID=118154 RepID=A0A9Q1I9F2_SYNKA|nr:hypothetical protein SKAU_G00428130 [Synaphobranchus kaupii]